MELKYSKQSLTLLKITSVKYHEIFDFKLTKEELIKWQYKSLKETTSERKNKGRLQREKYSKKKLLIANKVAKLIVKIPTVKFVGITGALAMNNAGRNSDIDLMIITKTNTLWTTRLLVYCILHTTSYILRRPRVKNERDALCLNMWLDEDDLVWNMKDRNIYTAHEIAQIVPLINKDNTYEKFLYLNRWILNHWPNAVNMPYALSNKPYAKKTIKYAVYSITRLFEKLSFKIQYLYMKPKITREVISKTRAFFHPHDWGKVVLKFLNQDSPNY